MAMLTKMCGSCLRETKHNPMKDGGWRCTYCGSPVTTNPAKRETAELIRKQQAAKPTS